MKPKRKSERDAIREISKLTDDFEMTLTNNGHIKVTLIGRRRAVVIISGSPSDKRAWKNVMTDIKRAMNICDIQPKEGGT